MTTQPGDDTAAGKAGRGHLRASNADREQVISTLKAAFVQGMLGKDELDARVGRAFASRTRADLAAVTADLPAGLAAALPPAPAQAPGIPRPGWVLAVTTVLYAGAWVYALLSPRGSDEQTAGPLIFLGSFLYLSVLLFAGGQILADRLDKRSGGQSPQGPAPGAGGQASRRLPSAGPRGSADPGHWHAADAAPIGRPRLLPS